MILEYHEHELYHSNPLFSGMTHFSLTGSGPTANTVFTWWQAATKQGHNKSYKRHRFGIMQGSIPCLVSYREPQRTIQSQPIWLHSWFSSDSVTTQRASAKLRHDRVPYDSALILLPHRVPQWSWHTIECRMILLWFCYHSESPSETDARLSAIRFCSDSVATQRAQNWTVYDPCMFTRDETNSRFVTEIYIDWFYDSHITEYLCCWFRKSNYFLFALMSLTLF